MRHQNPESSDRTGASEAEARLARARLAFDEHLREASETGVRAAQRMLIPALWGAALVGGALLAIAVVRLVRRPNTAPALLRVSIEPRFESRALLPVLGGAVARLAMKRLLATSASAPASPLSSTLKALRPPAAARQTNSSPHGSSNGRATA